MPDFNPIVTKYKNVNAFAPPLGQVPLLAVFDTISGTELEKKILWLRSLDEKRYKSGKKSLPCVTFSGSFKAAKSVDKKTGELVDCYRSEEGLIEHTHVLLYDLDHLTPEELERYRILLRDNPYVFAFFISPSGKGLKVLFRESYGQHLPVWVAVNEYLRKGYGLPIDESGKDVCRLCFLSYDPTLYYNPDCDIISAQFVADNTPPPPKPKASVKPAKRAPATSTGDDLRDLLDKCHATVQKTVTAGAGTHNRYAGQFSQQAMRREIPEQDCLAELQTYLAAYDQHELPKVVASHYKHTKEWGKYPDTLSSRAAKQTGADTAQPDPSVASGDPDPQLPSRYDEKVKFWDVFTKTDKDGNVSTSTKLSYDKGIDFLQNNGFFKFELKGDRYKLIYLDRAAKVVYNVNELRVTEYMLGYLKAAKQTGEIRTVRELFRRSTGICADQNLKGLEYYTPQLCKETATSGALYFTNCWVDITPEQPIIRQYSDLPDLIWKNQQIDRDFTLSDWQGCDVYLFLCRAILGHKAAPEKWTDNERLKMQSVSTTIGYLVHTYKNPSVNKMVMATDGSLRDGEENNGRTGKSLLGNILTKVINTTYVDGKRYKEDDKFAWQKVTSDTRVIWLDDPKKGLDITNFFSQATEGLDVEKKNQAIESFDKETSPKYYIPMNYTLRGDGASHRDRLQIIEFSNYYSDENKPVHEFGRLFFYEWDADEWSRFYSFIIFCKQQHLQHGLVPFPLENYHINKLVEQAGQGFIDFMDDIVLANVSRDPDALSPGKEQYILTELHEAYLATLKNVKYPPTDKSITRNIKAWAKERRLIVDPRTGGTLAKAGLRDRRSNITYITFAKADEGALQTLPADDGSLPF